MSSLSRRERRSPIVAPRAVLRIRLVGGKEGRIPLADLGELAGGVQDAILRIARRHAYRSGPGRTPEDLKAWISLDAAAIEPGSAVLVVEAPGLDEEQLPLEDIGDPGLEALSDLDDALEAMSRGEPLPQDIDPLTEQTLRTMLRRLSSYERVEWHHEAAGTSRTIVIDPNLGDPEPKANSDQRRSKESLAGRLYQLNLRSHRYGIEDDLGRSIHCEFPSDAQHLEEIRRLVGRRIVLTGTAFRDETGGIARFEVDRIRAADTDETGGEFFSFDLEAALLATQAVSDLSSLSIEDLTETEAEDFWRALHE